ncbi:hypothetical protein EAF04_004765 [Stromatinia cepivora]|nr:hypothetical protein EAF04_004765 [Stromatinia cepivora]
MGQLNTTNSPNATYQLSATDQLNTTEREEFVKLWEADRRNHPAAAMSAKMNEKAKAGVEGMDKKKGYSITRMSKVIKAYKKELQAEEERLKREKEAEDNH